MEENAKLTEGKQRRHSNLNPFKKGQSGNPKGRPIGSVSITAEIKARLLKVFPEKQAQVTRDDGKKIFQIKKTYLQKIVEATFDNAIVQKDQRSINQIWAYIDGQPKATLDIDVDKESLASLTDFFRAIANKNKK